jgi:amino acid adenylation domain-containing protein
VTYLELERTSNRIANFMQEKTKTTPQVILILDRSPELIEAIVALLKCGLVFVPLNPLFPGNRVKTMIEETRAQWVITTSYYYEKFREVIKGNKNTINTLLIDGESRDSSVFCLDPEIAPSGVTFEPIYPENCYIYFTSGSTGIPKGVLGRERGLAHFIQWEIREFNLDETAHVSQFTPPSFDPFLRDIFVPLAAGATCCIPDSDTLMNPGELIKWIDENNITLIHTVKSLFKKIVSELEDPGCFQHLKYILLAGELLRGQDIRRFSEIFKDRIQLVNIYGPTETTLAKLFYRIKAGDTTRAIIPVGKPIDGTRIFLLDSKKQKCPVGKKGEIYIRTSFSSAGYYNDPALTKEVFIKNPHDKDSGEIIYKSGDMGRLLPDGNLELSGRIDRQVKIRGVRIEVGEIENLLLKYPQVKDAVAVARDDENGDKYLCAYLVPTQTIELKDLRQYLAGTLPEYMIPAYFVFLEKMPLNLNGKVDRESLPEPEISRDNEYAAPENETQAKLAQIWASALNLDKEVISIDASFFDLGGHSLRATSLLSQIQKEFQITVSLEEIFRIPTVRALSGIITAQKNRTAERPYAPLSPVEKKEYYPLSVPQQKVFKGGKNHDGGYDSGSTAYNIPYVYIIEEKIDPQQFNRAFQVLVRHHEVLRTFFQWVAGEAVQRVKDNGEFTFTVSCHSLNEAEAQKRTGDFIKPFDLNRPPLFRVELIEVEPEKYYVLFDVHHIIMEAASLGMMMRDLTAFYLGEKPSPLQVQFKDYATWQNKTIADGTLEKYEKYWLSKLEGFKATRLPADYPGSSGEIRFKSADLALSQQMCKAIDDFCHEQKMTRFSFFIAVLNIILAGETRENDITIAARVTTRSHYELRNTAGPFLNKVFVRTVIEPGDTFLANLSRINQAVVEAMAHSVYPYELLETRLLKDNNMAHQPLSSIVVNYLHPPEKNGQPVKRPMKMKATRLKESYSSYDIHLIIIDEGETMRLHTVYKENLYPGNRIGHILECFHQVSTRVLENPGTGLEGFLKMPDSS